MRWIPRPRAHIAGRPSARRNRRAKRVWGWILGAALSFIPHSRLPLGPREILRQTPAQIVRIYESRPSMEKQTIPLSLLIAAAQRLEIPPNERARFRHRIPEGAFSTIKGKALAFEEFIWDAYREVTTNKYLYAARQREIGRGLTGFKQLDPIDQWRVLMYFVLHREVLSDNSGHVWINKMGVDEEVNSIIGRSAELFGRKKEMEEIMQSD